MCEMQKLRASVEQILTAAAEEIFGVFKRSIAEIEEKLSDSPKHKRNQRLPETTVQQTGILIPPEQQKRSLDVNQEDREPPHIKEDREEEQTMKLTLLSECPTLIQKLWMVKEELPLEPQERSPSLDQVDPEPPHTKKEENLWTNQEGEQLQGLVEAAITKFSSTPPLVKSEYDEDKAQTSQLHQSQTEENTEESEDGDDYEGSEPDITISNVTCRTTHQYTEDEKACKFSSVLETQMTDKTRKKPFSCSLCKKGFGTKSQLKQHTVVHTGERPFSCSVCKKFFALKGNLNKHMLVHTGERPFSCSLCKKGFTQRCHLKEHMSIHTGERPFICSVCEKGFARRKNLKDHMLVHTAERPFSCSVCKKVFARRCEVQRHMAVHTGERPFSCSVCNKGFANKQILKRHVNSHRKEGFHPLSL